LAAGNLLPQTAFKQALFLPRSKATFEQAAKGEPMALQRCSFSLIFLACAFMVFTLLNTAVALAQTPNRFSFQPVDGGLMRLDTETGQVSLCTKTGADFICRSVADDRAALDDEITRLKRENDTLRQAQAGRLGSASPKLSLPSEEELDKAMTMFEKMMRRMMRSFNDEGAAPNKL
jgi:hypothetical protein